MRFKAVSADSYSLIVTELRYRDEVVRAITADSLYALISTLILQCHIFCNDAISS